MRLVPTKEVRTMQKPLPTPFVAMAYNNAWANHRLLSACLALRPGEFTAPRVGFFPSLAETVNHNHLVDLFYIDAMEGGTLGVAAFDNEIPFLRVAELITAQRALDVRLIVLTRAAEQTSYDATISVHRQDHVQEDRFDRILMHLFQHQIHHRGQAHAMLSATSVAPPQLDEFFMEDEASFRTVEFDALGWNETMIWGNGKS